MLRHLISIGILVALATVAAAQTAMCPCPAQPRTIAVTGTAQTMAFPDMAIISLAVQDQAATVAQAAARNNTTAMRIMEAITALRIARLTMTTAGFDVQPVYEQLRPDAQSQRPPRIVGYQVTNRLEVRIREANATRLSTDTGRVLDAALAAGANRVDGVDFTIENVTPVTTQLLGEAVRNARAQADAVAAAANVRIQRVLSISAGSAVPPPPRPVFRMDAMVAAGGVPIVAGEQMVQVSVSMVYEIQ